MTIIEARKLGNQLRQKRNIALGKFAKDEYVRRYYAHLPKPQNNKYSHVKLPTHIP